MAELRADVRDSAEGLLTDADRFALTTMARSVKGANGAFVVALLARNPSRSRVRWLVDTLWRPYTASLAGRAHIYFDPAEAAAALLRALDLHLADDVVGAALLQLYPDRVVLVGGRPIPNPPTLDPSHPVLVNQQKEPPK